MRSGRCGHEHQILGCAKDDRKKSKSKSRSFLAALVRMTRVRGRERQILRFAQDHRKKSRSKGLRKAGRRTHGMHSIAAFIIRLETTASLTS